MRSPKVYISESGLLHNLLGVQSWEDLDTHPKIGASWEGFVIKEIQDRFSARLEECCFWATHSGAELDLLVIQGQRRLGFEIKRTTSPSFTRSMRSAFDSLGLDRMWIVHAGEHSFALGENVEAMAFTDLAEITRQ